MVYAASPSFLWFGAGGRSCSSFLASTVGSPASSHAVPFSACLFFSGLGIISKTRKRAAAEGSGQPSVWHPTKVRKIRVLLKIMFYLLPDGCHHEYDLQVIWGICYCIGTAKVGHECWQFLKPLHRTWRHWTVQGIRIIVYWGLSWGPLSMETLHCTRTWQKFERPTR